MINNIRTLNSKRFAFTAILVAAVFFSSCKRVEKSIPDDQGVIHILHQIIMAEKSPDQNLVELETEYQPEISPQETLPEKEAPLKFFRLSNFVAQLLFYCLLILITAITVYITFTSSKHIHYDRLRTRKAHRTEKRKKKAVVTKQWGGDIVQNAESLLSLGKTGDAVLIIYSGCIEFLARNGLILFRDNLTNSEIREELKEHGHLLKSFSPIAHYSEIYIFGHMHIEDRICRELIHTFKHTFADNKKL